MKTGVRARFFSAGLALLILLALTWLWHGAPSWSEWRFHRRLAEQMATPPASLDLVTLMSGDWELVCDAHCYSGLIHLKQYGRTYAPVSACHDSAWGLIFVSADGSHDAASGNCRPHGLTIHLDRCLTRASAKLHRLRERSGCPEYGVAKTGDPK